MTSTPDWRHLGAVIHDRRVELGYRRRADFAAALRRTPRVVSDLENGRRANYSPVTLALLELVLRWRVGAHRDVLAGLAAQPRDTPTR